MNPWKWQLSWENIGLIYQRELRDQLRDRRTLFTIVVLPMLLYPLLAMTVFQIQQFRQVHPSKIRFVGADALTEMPPLLVPVENDAEVDTSPDAIKAVQFADEVCPAAERHLYKIESVTASSILKEEKEGHATLLHQAAQDAIANGQVDAVVYFPPGFADKWRELQAQRLERGKETASDDAEQEKPSAALLQPQVYVNRAVEKSQLAAERVGWVLEQWRQKLVAQSLRENNLPENTIRPFEVTTEEVAPAGRPRAAIWSKVLPLVLLIWALTGAFYPAIDLCAGEKERGTLETLLCSPALRGEIVWGKLLTVMTFSMATSLLNLVGMGMTGTFMMKQISNMATQPLPIEVGPPPLMAIVWLVVALVPISALFSALALSIATFARSSKEGQYYLMPLLMISLPLLMLPIMPSTQLDLGTSLVPLSGLMLLLRALIEGQYVEAAKYVFFVAAVTATCCWISIRWAIHQFQSETVLFRESERFQLGWWLKHLLRDREDMPTVGEGIFCGLLILILRFFVNFLIPQPQNWQQFASVNLVVQVAVIAMPAVLMAMMLTRKPLAALSLRGPSFWTTVPAAVLLAMLLQPAFHWMAMGISVLYPIDERMLEQLKDIEGLLGDMPLGVALLMVAVTPAICEELAFRGFILSGLRRMGTKWGAIVLASAFFGIAHGILQQSLGAFAIGIVLGYVAVKTGSLLPAMLYHATHNGLTVLIGQIDEKLIEKYPLLKMVFMEIQDKSDVGYVYQPVYAVASAIVGILLLLWFKRLPYHASAEETLQEAMDRPRSTASPVA